METRRISKKFSRNTGSAALPRFMTHERVSRLLIGIAILLGLAIGRCVTPWGYLALAGVAVNLIQYAFTGRCKVKQLLDWLGVPYER